MGGNRRDTPPLRRRPWRVPVFSFFVRPMRPSLLYVLVVAHPSGCYFFVSFVLPSLSMFLCSPLYSCCCFLLGAFLRNIHTHTPTHPHTTGLTRDSEISKIDRFVDSESPLSTARPGSRPRFQIGFTVPIDGGPRLARSGRSVF